MSEDVARVFWRKDVWQSRISPHRVAGSARSKWKLVKLSNNPHGNLDGSLLTSWTVGTKFVASASPKPMARSLAFPSIPPGNPTKPLTRWFPRLPFLQRGSILLSSRFRRSSQKRHFRNEIKFRTRYKTYFSVNREDILIFLFVIV